MPLPTASQVADYFDAFGANAVHTWATGLPARIDAFRAANHAGFRYVSWVEKDGKSLANGQLLGGIAKNSAGRIGFQIGDEPADDAALDVMLASASAVRAADPDALVIVNFADNPNTDALLGRAAANTDVDVLSIDRYTYKDDAYPALARVRAAGLAAAKPYWRYLDSFGTSGDTSPSESDMRWDAMVGLLYGFTGYTWFIYQVDAPSDLPELFLRRQLRLGEDGAVHDRSERQRRGGSARPSADPARQHRRYGGTALLQLKGTTSFSAERAVIQYLSSDGEQRGVRRRAPRLLPRRGGEIYVMLLNPHTCTHGRFPLSPRANEHLLAGVRLLEEERRDARRRGARVDGPERRSGWKTRTLTATGARDPLLDGPARAGPGVLVQAPKRSRPCASMIHRGHARSAHGQWKSAWATKPRPRLAPLATRLPPNARAKPGRGRRTTAK
ncbi:MAG: hypothetical protein U0235_30275 [Polyangiaceae bacterium]